MNTKRDVNDERVKRLSWLRGMRNFQDMTLAELSRLSGIDSPSLCRMESGKVHISPKNARVLAGILGCSARLLLTNAPKDK
jgi:transcriptional regulator with XRE-family HTH domain